MAIRCQSSLTLTSNHTHSPLEDRNVPSSRATLHLRCLRKPVACVTCRPDENGDVQYSKCVTTAPRNSPRDTHPGTLATSSMPLRIFPAHHTLWERVPERFGTHDDAQITTSGFVSKRFPFQKQRRWSPGKVHKDVKESRVCIKKKKISLGLTSRRYLGT